MSPARTRSPVVMAMLAPLLVGAGVLTRPFVGNFTDTELVVRRAAEAPGRWAAGSLLVAAGFVLAAVTAVGLAVALSDGRPSRGASVAGGAAVIGAGLIAYQLGGSGIGISSAVRSGGDVTRFVDEAGTWEVPVLGAGIVLLAVAWITLARLAAPLVGSGLSTVGAVAASAGLLIPSSLGEYVTAVGLALLLVPIALVVANRSLAGHAG